MTNNAAKLLQDHKEFLPANSPVPNRRILVVDDEVEIAKGIKLILAPEKAAAVRSSRTVAPIKQEKSLEEFDVVIVHTPDDALKAIESARKENKPFAMGFFDVVLNNPKIDGIELVKQAFALDPQIFAVFVTAYHDRSVDAIGAFLGAENREKWDYINKPFTPGEILQKARNTTSLWDLHRLKEWQEERLSELNQLLLQNERQNTAAAVGRGVAHEFGNLLTHIVGNAEIAIQKNDLAAMKNALEVILKASDTATNVLKKLRKLNDSGEAPSNANKPINVWQPVEEALELVDFQLRKRFIRATKARSKRAMVFGNRHTLVQVFVNILINSMHAMPDGGDIRVEANMTDDTVEILFRDTGPGVDEKILHRLTEPLFTTKGANGSGLGLSICKEIVEFEHAGELIFRNHAGGGLEVLIRLPLAAEVADLKEEKKS